MPIEPSETTPLAPTVLPNDRVEIVKIDGVVLNQTAVVGDERGIILEVIDTRSTYWSAPVPYVYMGTCRPGKAKGWGLHERHTDRYTILSGEMLLVLFDDRTDSPSHGVVQEFYLTMEGRNQVTIPIGVWHAHMNLGQDDVMFLNAPTEPFDHANPDKRTLPLDTDKIPYSFFTGLGR